MRCIIFTFRVKDTGIGMRKEDIDMAFQTFGQVDSGLNRRYEGTGLGLPLTKKLVELHNGSIRIDSALYHGTTVMVRLISDKALLLATQTSN
jgi:two-component system, cell cycle sensor histidine kinase PleC